MDTIILTNKLKRKVIMYVYSYVMMEIIKFIRKSKWSNQNLNGLLSQIKKEGQKLI